MIIVDENNKNENGEKVTFIVNKNENGDEEAVCIELYN